MECFNHSCQCRVNETSNANRCECVTMAKYIDLEAALREIERRERLMVGDKTIHVGALKRFLLNRPAADASPVVHGRWKRYGKNLGECSECGEIVSVRSNYCPNCGAKMME